MTIKFNEAIVVHDDRGDLPGRIVGRDGDHARVMIYRDRSPQWFIDQHTSKVPHLWYPVDRVELA